VARQQRLDSVIIGGVAEKQYGKNTGVLGNKLRNTASESRRSGQNRVLAWFLLGNWVLLVTLETAFPTLFFNKN